MTEGRREREREREREGGEREREREMLPILLANTPRCILLREHVLVREHILVRASHPCTKRNSAFPEEEEEEESAAPRRSKTVLDLSHVGHVTGHRSLPAACAGPASSSRPAGIDVSASSRQSLHLLLSRWCWQMLAPPHSMHLLLSLWCGQMLAPPHSLHLLLSLWCWQMQVPARGRTIRSAVAQHW